MSAAIKPNIVNVGVYDATRLRPAASCLRQFMYAHVYGLVHAAGVEAFALDLEFGRAAHVGFEAYDRAKFAGAKADQPLLAALRAAWDASVDIPAPAAPDADTSKNRQTLLRLFVWYDAEVGRNDILRTIRGVDGAPMIEVACSIELMTGQTLVSRPDGMVEFEPGELWLRERKTTGSSPGRGYDARWSPDIQISMQALFARGLVTPVLRGKYKMRGVILEASHLQVGSVRFSRVPCRRTDAQLDEFFGVIKALVVDVDRRLKSTDMSAAPSANAKLWPANEAVCALCRYKSICATDPSDRDRVIALEYAQREPWDPLHGVVDVDKKRRKQG